MDLKTNLMNYISFHHLQIEPRFNQLVSALLRHSALPSISDQKRVAEKVQHLSLHQDCHVPTPQYYPYAVQNCVDIWSLFTVFHPEIYLRSPR